jgi:hypothetical protein
VVSSDWSAGPSRRCLVLAEVKGHPHELPHRSGDVAGKPPRVRQRGIVRAGESAAL